MELLLMRNIVAKAMFLECMLLKLDRWLMAYAGRVPIAMESTVRVRVRSQRNARDNLIGFDHFDAIIN